MCEVFLLFLAVIKEHLSSGFIFFNSRLVLIESDNRLLTQADIWIMPVLYC